jgi:hypothetical protein
VKPFAGCRLRKRLRIIWRPNVRQGPPLEHSGDYRVINFNGQWLGLTPGKAAIVRVLYKSPYYEASTRTIKRQTRCGRIYDSLESGDGLEIFQKVHRSPPQRLLPKISHLRTSLAQRPQPRNVFRLRSFLLLRSSDQFVALALSFLCRRYVPWRAAGA